MKINVKKLAYSVYIAYKSVARKSWALQSSWETSSPALSIKNIRTEDAYIVVVDVIDLLSVVMTMMLVVIELVKWVETEAMSSGIVVCK